MAEQKQQKLERIYTIPLRRFWGRVPEYKRSRKAVLAIKNFIAKHMKVTDRNIDNVKLDVYLNNEIWYRGHAKPPAKVKVKAVKDGDVVHVGFAELPDHVKFLKMKHLKIHKKEEKAPASKKEEPKEAKTAEQKTDEKEKEVAVEQQNLKQAESAQHAAKHTTPVKEPKIQRMALKK